MAHRLSCLPKQFFALIRFTPCRTITRSPDTGTHKNTVYQDTLFVFFTVPAGYLSGLLVSRAFGDTYGYLTAVELVGFGGMMLGGLLMSLWGDFGNRRMTLASGLSIFGAMAIGMGISQHFALYLILMSLYGVALTTVQTTITTMLQANSDHSMQGRVFGLMSSLYSSCYPFGIICAVLRQKSIRIMRPDAF